MNRQWIRRAVLSAALATAIGNAGCVSPRSSPCPPAAEPSCPPCAATTAPTCRPCECPAPAVEAVAPPASATATTTTGVTDAHLQALRRLPRATALAITARLSPNDAASTGTASAVTTSTVTAWLLADGATIGLDVGAAPSGTSSAPPRWPLAVAVDGRWVVGQPAAISAARGPRLDADLTALAKHERAVRAVPDGEIVGSAAGVWLAHVLTRWSTAPEAIAVSQDRTGALSAAAFAPADALETLRAELVEDLTGTYGVFVPFMTPDPDATWPGAAALQLLAADLAGRADRALVVATQADHVSVVTPRLDANVLLMRLLAAGAARTEPAAPPTATDLDVVLETLGQAVVRSALASPPPEGGGCHLPVDAPLTPNLADRACCGGALDRDGDQRCDDDPARASVEPWRSLGFSVPSGRLGVTLTRTSVGDRTTVTVGAVRDDFCDGNLTRLQRRVHLDRTAEGGCDALLEAGTILVDAPN
jgi:hypothetical protein